MTSCFPGTIVPGSEDHVFRELLVLVANRILLKMQDGRLTAEELEECGFMLRRVWTTAQAWKAKRTQYTLAEWVQKLVGIAKDAGVPVPEV